MSKIGKKPVEIPEGVEAKIEAGKLTVSGQKGKLEMDLHPQVQAKISENKLVFSIDDLDDRKKRAMWGTMRALADNLITGVQQGYEKQLEVVGVGYRVAADKKNLTLNIGYSHSIVLEIPEILEVKIAKNIITISGISKQIVGEFAALVRSQRPPEPYKGKGIKYVGEVIRRKAGKVMKTAGT